MRRGERAGRVAILLQSGQELTASIGTVDP
jgi:hypothetical protein